jgi:hypothetical protein
MGSAKHGGRILGLSVLAVWGLMALGAAGAQAKTHEEQLQPVHVLALGKGILPLSSALGSFSVNGGAPAGQTIVGAQLGSGYVLMAARDLKIECQGSALNSGVINNSTDAEVTVTFTGCVVNNHAGTPIKACQFKELETIKAAALALPILHGGQRFVLFEPLGETFTTVSFKPETVCTLPLNNPIKGSITAKVEGELEETVLTLVFSEAIQLLSGDVLKYGALANTSYLNRASHVELEGGGTLGVH